MKRLILIAVGIALILNTPVAAQQAGDNVNVLPVVPFDDENPKWKEFKKLSGWHDLGADDKASLKKYKDGDTVKGEDVGLEKGKEYILSRRYERTYVFEKNAKFGTGAYTKTNPLDDFSETFMQYILDGNNLKKTAPEKHKFMKEFVD